MSPPANERFKEEQEIWFKGASIKITEHWMKSHPGGSKVLRIFNGRDATEQMLAMHSDEAVKTIERMAGGSKTKHIRDAYKKTPYLELLEIAQKEDLFTPSLSWELWKSFYSFGSVVLGVALFIQGFAWTGALFLAFGWFQLGWLGHDWGHHTYLPESTTEATYRCDWACFVTGAVRGTTMTWWKLRHNTHHVVTNEVGSDPDIKLAPVLHFFEDFAPGCCQRFQALYYVPLLVLLHLYWYVEAWQVSLRQIKSVNKATRWWAGMDILGLVGHTLFFGWLTATTGHYWAIAFAYAVSGLATALVVFATHYGEERLTMEQKASAKGEHPPAPMGLVEQTTRTSRNICGFLPWGLDQEFWFQFTGGLNTQVEHHLFPRMPRHNLRRMTKRVKAKCKELGLAFKEDNLYECTRRCVEQLGENAYRNIDALRASRSKKD